MKGWIKLKSKKILGLLLVITLLSASVFGSINVFAASGDTHVALESYMPPIKTLFVDDDFQNRAVGSTATEIAEGKTAYDKPIKKAEAGVNAAKTDTNIYANYSERYKKIELCDKIISKTSAPDNLAISFRFNMSSFASSKYFMLRFGSKPTTQALQFQQTSSNGIRISGYKLDSSSSSGSGVAANQITQNISSSDNWISFFVIFERVSNTAKIKKLVINGNEITVPDTKKDLLADCNWWMETTVSGEALKTINIGGSANTGLMVDDILVYEPQTVYFKDVTQTGLTIVNDSSSEPVTGNLFLALYDTDGNLLMANPYGSDVTVAAGESRTINAPTGSITDLTGVAKAKIFYWNGTTLAPICYAAEMSIS